VGRLASLPWRLILAGALVGLVTAAASHVDPGRLFEFLELKALNGQFNVRGPVAPRSPIVPPPPTIVRLLTVLAGIVAVLAAARLHLLAAFGVVAGVAFAYLAGTHAAFPRGSGWTPCRCRWPRHRLLRARRARLHQEQREKRRLSRFFSPEVVKEIVRYRDDATLDSGRRRMTVLFSDIAASRPSRSG
jgi:hypothetical protein